MADETDLNAVGRCLRAPRTSQALACGEVAARVGLGPERLRAIEKGDGLPSAALLQQMSCLFEVEPGYFFAAAVGPHAPGRPARGEEAAGELGQLHGASDEETLDLLRSPTCAAGKLRR